MKLCAACHEDLPKDRFSKKQWKLEKRRCKACVADNREVQPLPPSPPTNNNNELANNNEPNDGGIDRLLESMSMNDNEMTPSDEDLFKQPPTEDCPICFLQMPLPNPTRKYQICCGKSICVGCMYAVSLRNKDQLCPFCRIPAPTLEGLKEMLMKRVEKNDASAIYNLGSVYYRGLYGFPQNTDKALELLHRAGELGHAGSYHNIGNVYSQGRWGVERDKKKARHYWELAAIGGDAMARYNLGIVEKNMRNWDRALKHYMIAASGGYSDSMTKIKELYTDGHTTKDDYAKALRAHQSYLDEIRSDQRDRAAACSDDFKYY